MRQFAYSTARVPAEEYYISKIFVILPTCPYGPILGFAVEPPTVFSGIWQVSVFSHFALGFGFLRFWQDITENYLIGLLREILLAAPIPILLHIRHVFTNCWSLPGVSPI